MIVYNLDILLFLFLPWESHEQCEKAKRQDTERWTPQVGRCHYATWDQWRNNSRKNEEMETMQKQHPAVDVTGDRSKVRCCKEKYCISQLEWYKKIASLFSLKARNLDVGSSRDFQKSHSVTSAFIPLGYPWLQGEIIDGIFSAGTPCLCTELW